MFVQLKGHVKDDCVHILLAGSAQIPILDPTGKIEAFENVWLVVFTGGFSRECVQE